MAAPDDVFEWPAALPGPLAAPRQSAERRVLSGLPGPRQSRALVRDQRGTEQVEFAFTFGQMGIFTAWLESIAAGGAWFSASAPKWPTPQGGISDYRFVGAPTYPRYLPNVGWRVSALVEVRAHRDAPGPGPAPPPGPILLMEFDSWPFVESTGNGWTDPPAGPNSDPGSLDGAVLARPHVLDHYYSLQTNHVTNSGLLLPSLQWTMEFFVSRAGTINPGGSSWEVGIEIGFETVDSLYSAGMLFSVGWVHNDPTLHPIPWITWTATGTIYNFIASPDAPLTLQSDRMTHIALTFDNGTVKVYCHGVLVGNYVDAVAVSEADTGAAFPANSVYGYWFNLTQYFGDTSPAYIDDVIVTAGVKYSGTFTPTFKAIPA